MAIKQTFYAVCDECGTALEGTFPEPMLFESEQQARAGAREYGWQEFGGQLLCGHICRELVETDTERDVAASAPAVEMRVERADVDAMLPQFLLEMYGQAAAEGIEAAEAWGALVYRVGERLRAGEDFKDIFDQLDADDVQFAPHAIDPAAFLASRINQLPDA